MWYSQQHHNEDGSEMVIFEVCLLCFCFCRYVTPVGDDIAHVYTGEGRLYNFPTLLTEAPTDKTLGELFREENLWFTGDISDLTFKLFTINDAFVYTAETRLIDVL